MAMKKILKGWKVTDDSETRVCIHGKSRHELRSVINTWMSRSVTYKRHRWAKPRPGNGPLCVFKLKKDAVQFMADDAQTAVVSRCKYVPSTLDKLWYTNSAGVKYYRTLDMCPIGTRFASRVMLTGRPLSLHNNLKCEWVVR